MPYVTVWYMSSRSSRKYICTSNDSGCANNTIHRLQHYYPARVIYEMYTHRRLPPRVVRVRCWLKIGFVRGDEAIIKIVQPFVPILFGPETEQYTKRVIIICTVNAPPPPQKKFSNILRNKFIYLYNILYALHMRM